MWGYERERERRTWERAPLPRMIGIIPKRFCSFMSARAMYRREEQSLLRLHSLYTVLSSILSTSLSKGIKSRWYSNVFISTENIIEIIENWSFRLVIFFVCRFSQRCECVDLYFVDRVLQVHVHTEEFVEVQRKWNKFYCLVLRICDL